MSCNHPYVNFKFQPKKDVVVITIFSNLLFGKQGYCESRVETKFIVTYLLFFCNKTKVILNPDRYSIMKCHWCMEIH
jgi:hypothetical protein